MARTLAEFEAPRKRKCTAGAIAFHGVERVTDSRKSHVFSLVSRHAAEFRAPLRRRG
jgi:hypothetical protein